MTAYGELLDCAVAAARAAGDHALRNAARRTDAAVRMRHDVKLRLDIECQAIAEEAVRARFPSHAVLAEEQPEEAQRHEAPEGFQWVIDPIDGTVNFSHGFPWWCCSVAVRRGEEVLAGAVYAPALGRLYTAAADGPALGDGAPLAVSSVSSLEQALVFTAPDAAARPLGLFSRIVACAQRARIVGSAALDLCQVAAGAGEAYFQCGVYLWDVAAAGLIVRRAGGRAEVLRRQDGGRLCYLGTNGRVHDALARALVPGIPA